MGGEEEGWRSARVVAAQRSSASSRVVMSRWRLTVRRNDRRTKDDCVSNTSHSWQGLVQLPFSTEDVGEISIVLASSFELFLLRSFVPDPVAVSVKSVSTPGRCALRWPLERSARGRCDGMLEAGRCHCGCLGQHRRRALRCCHDALCPPLENTPH